MKNKNYKLIMSILIFLVLALQPAYASIWTTDWGEWEPEGDITPHSYNWGSVFATKPNEWLFDLGDGWFGQFMQRTLGADAYDAASSSVCEKFVDQPGTPAGVMLGEGGYPVGHIEGSYYEYYEFNETTPYNYPDDEGDVGPDYEIKRIYTISFEIDPKDIAGSDTIDLKFTVGGEPLDLDLTNDTIENVYEIDVDGEPFSMKGENVMVRNATKSGDKWKMQTGVKDNGDPIWTEIIAEGKDSDTKVCIEFSPEKELNPEFSSYLINGNKACNTFKAEIGVSDLFDGLPNPWTT